MKKQEWTKNDITFAGADHLFSNMNVALEAMKKLLLEKRAHLIITHKKANK